MAPRPYWKGYLKLSLVACPVAVFTATTSSERVSFRQINKQTGNRLRQQLVDDVTREPVEAADKVRGYEVDKNVYVQVEDEEIEALQVESNHTIDIDSFVPRAQIDERYLRQHLLHRAERPGRPRGVRGDPRGDARQGHGRARPDRARQARARHRAAAVGQGPARHDAALRLRGAQRRGIFRRDSRHQDLRRRCCKLAEHILESKAGDFDPTAFVDHYEEAVVDMLKRKQAGAPVSKQKARGARFERRQSDGRAASAASRRRNTPARPRPGRRPSRRASRTTCAGSRSSNSRSKAARPSSRRSRPRLRQAPRQSPSASRLSRLQKVTASFRPSEARPES